MKPRSRSSGLLLSSRPSLFYFFGKTCREPTNQHQANTTPNDEHQTTHTSQTLINLNQSTDLNPRTIATELTRTDCQPSHEVEDTQEPTHSARWTHPNWDRRPGPDLGRTQESVPTDRRIGQRGRRNGN
jgi:hypothetical protein